MIGRTLARVVVGLAMLVMGIGAAAAGPVAANVAGASSAKAASGNAATGSDRNGTYLALGDSVAFGYVPPNATPAPNYYDAHSFISYANDVATALDERVSNASCPGETTASMLTVGAQSNGCENSVTTPAGYRSAYPLHVAYQGSQMSYALKYLGDHEHTKLVTINIGANDAFVCEAEHACTSPTSSVRLGELETVLAQVETNLTTIFSKIRAVYSGPVVALDYYSLSYTTLGAEVEAELLNTAINTVAGNFTVIIANGFTAFKVASAGRTPCTAGLLIPVATTGETPTGGCNVHPTHLGQQVLATAVLQALTAAGLR